MKKLLFLLVFICVALVGNAQRRHYSGSHHTTSHGGHYAGGMGRIITVGITEMPGVVTGMGYIKQVNEGIKHLLSYYLFYC